MKKSKKTKAHKYVSKEKTVSGSWRYIYNTVKTGLTRTQAERDKMAEESSGGKKTEKKSKSILKTALNIHKRNSKGKRSAEKEEYVNKYVKTGRDYISEWYKKSTDNLHNFTVRSQSANKCRKKAKTLRDLLTQEV